MLTTDKHGLKQIGKDFKVNYLALTDEASWFVEGPCSTASPQA